MSARGASRARASHASKHRLANRVPHRQGRSRSGRRRRDRAPRTDRRRATRRDRARPAPVRASTRDRVRLRGVRRRTDADPGDAPSAPPTRVRGSGDRSRRPVTLTALETRTSPGCAISATRAPMCTARHRRLSNRISRERGEPLEEGREVCRSPTKLEMRDVAGDEDEIELASSPVTWYGWCCRQRPGSSCT